MSSKGFTPSDKAAARDSTPTPKPALDKPAQGAPSSAPKSSPQGRMSAKEHRDQVLGRKPNAGTDPPKKDGQKPAPKKPSDGAAKKAPPNKAGSAMNAAKNVKEQGVKGAAKQAGKTAAIKGAESAANTYTGGGYAAAKKAAQAAARVPGLRQVTKRTPGLNRLSGQKTGKPTIPGAKQAGKFKDELKSSASGKPGKASGDGGKVSGSLSKQQKMMGGGVLAAMAMLLVMLMAITSLSGGGGSADLLSTGPTSQDELDKIKDCIPEEYIPILKDATSVSGRTKEPSNIPWTMLAGLLSTQTGFGKASPYDNIDRYQALKMSEDCFAGGTGGSDTPADGDIGPDGEHVAVPAGEVPEEYLGMLQRLGAVCEIEPYVYAGFFRTESNWDHKAAAGSSTAKGMGQFLDPTWASEGKDFNGDGLKEIGNPYDNMWSTAQYACQILGMYKEAKAANPDQWKDTNLVDAAIQGYHDGPYYQKENGPGISPTINQEEARGYLPKVRGFAEDFKKKYPELAKGDANAKLPDNKFLEPRKFPNGDSGGGTGSENCAIPTDPNPIGGMSETQGVGPYLLSLGAANEARRAGYDPQSPCVSRWVADQLKKKAGEMSSAGITAGYPEFFKGVKYDPEDDDAMEKTAANRLFYQAVLTHSGLFVDKKIQSTSCEVQQDGEPEDDKIAEQVAYSQIVGTFNCILTTEYLLYTVQSAKAPSGEAGELPSFSFTSDRREQRDLIIDEAAKFSYAAHNGWKKDMTCSATANTAQGLIPLTKEEFLSAGYDDPADRCDQAKNVRAAALLFVRGEKVPVSARDNEKPYTPMLGGWGEISAALGSDMERFQNSGPAYTSSANADRCFPSISAFVEQWASNEKAGEEIVALVDGNRENANAVLDGGKKILAKHKIKSIAQRENCTGVSDQDAGQRAGAHAQSMMSTSGEDQKKVYDAIATWATFLQTRNAAPARNAGSSKIERLSPVVYKPVSIPSTIEVTPAVQEMLDATAGGAGSSAGFAEAAVDATVYYGWFGDGGNPDNSTAGVRTGSLANGDNDPFAGVQGAPSDGGSGTTAPDKCPPEGYVPPHAEMAYKPQPAGISIAELCKRSVAGARNPETAKALMWAFSNVGKQAYRMDARRNALGVSDCSAYVSRAYAETTGLALYHGDDPKASPNPFITTDFTEAIAPSVTADQIRPGDIGVNTGHIVFYLTKDLIMDTGSDDSPPRVQPAFGSYRMARIDVTKVPKKDLYVPAPFIPGVSDQWVPKDKL